MKVVFGIFIPDFYCLCVLVYALVIYWVGGALNGSFDS